MSADEGLGRCPCGRIGARRACCSRAGVLCRGCFDDHRRVHHSLGTTPGPASETEMIARVAGATPHQLDGAKITVIHHGREIHVWLRRPE